MIEGVKKKIVSADQKDRQQIGENLPAIFKEGLDNYFIWLFFNGSNLINMFEKNERLISEKMDEAFDSFDNYVEEIKTCVN